MSSGSHAALLVPGLATGIGSLPGSDAARAVEMVLAETPRLPFVPQLPNRSPREGMLAQWLEVLPEVTVAPDGAIVVDRDAASGAPTITIDPASHSGLVALLAAARGREEEFGRIKVQMTGPLTLGVALMRAGLPSALAFERAKVCAAEWAAHLQATVEARLPATRMMLFLDEPALVRWAGGDDPIERDDAIDVLSSTLARVTCVTGVHVCGDGDLRVAHAAGPDVLGLTASDALVAESDTIMRHLEADGWIAWGAVPTDRPIGDSTEGPWRRLVGLWCDLTRRGCDPVRLRTHGLVTPACGLAGHGESQAVRALRVAREMADRIGDQAVAARLTVGA
ncbi:MAG: hypothetical protein ACKOZL_07000 [Actinomycetes bacterium]